MPTLRRPIRRCCDGSAGAWHLLWAAVHRASPGRQGEAGASARIRTCGSDDRRWRDAAFRGLPATMQVWMSHGDEALELPGGFKRTAITSNALAGIANEEAPDLGGAVSSRGAPHAAWGRNYSVTLSSISAGRREIGHRRTLSRRPWHRSAKRWQGSCDLRAVGRRGFVGGGGAGAQGDREPAYVRVCQQRRAAQERVCRGAEEPARQAGAEPGGGGCERALSCRSSRE